MEAVHCRSDGSIDYDFYRQQALRERYTYVGQVLSHAVPAVSPPAKRRVRLFAAAFLVATGAFWATMLTSPPETEASSKPFSVYELHRTVPLDLPVSVADAI